MLFCSSFIPKVLAPCDPQCGQNAQQDVYHCTTLLRTSERHYDTGEWPTTMKKKIRGDLETQGFTSINKFDGGIMCLDVVTHPDIPDRVYKLVPTDVNSDPYILFARWVFESRIWEENPHFPRIFDLLESDRSDVAVICMEKLEHFPKKPYHDIHPEYAPYVEYTKEYLRQPEVINEYAVSTSYKRAVELLSRHFDGVPVYWDIHGRNIMIRGHIPVITDPVSPS